MVSLMGVRDDSEGEEDDGEVRKKIGLSWDGECENEIWKEVGIKRGEAFSESSNEKQG